MKKMIALVWVLVCILGLAGCNNNSMNNIIKTKPNVTGIVKEVHNDYVIMYSDTADGYPNGSEWQISLNVENKDSYTDLAIGDEIVVYHDGNVMETDPLKVGIVYAITLKTPADRIENDKFYLTIGADNVKRIELIMQNESGGCEHADGSLFKRGERVWLESLDGYNDLRGVTITALDEKDIVIWSVSIPNGEENIGFTHLTQDGWVITKIE